MQRLALVGAGSVKRIHARNIAAHADAGQAVICDQAAENARELALEHCGRAVASVGAALEVRVDGVVIASSTASHVYIAAACTAARVPFLCEKPLAFGIGTAQQIVETARNAGIIAAMAFNRRFDTGYAGIKAAIDAEEIGSPEALLITSRTASPPTIDFTRTSGGLLGEKGAPFCDLACWITGEDPVELFAMGAALINRGFAKIGEVDTAMLILRMPSGTLCQFDFSWRAAYGQDERLEVNGELGILQTPQGPSGGYVRSAAAGQTHPGQMPGWYARFAPTYVHELDLFVKAIGGDSAAAQELPGLEGGLAAHRITDAARRSVEKGMSMRLS